MGRINAPSLRRVAAGRSVRRPCTVFPPLDAGDPQDLTAHSRATASRACGGRAREPLSVADEFRKLAESTGAATAANN